MRLGSDMDGGYLVPDDFDDVVRLLFAGAVVCLGPHSKLT